MAISNAYPKGAPVEDFDLFVGTKAFNNRTVNYTSQGIADYLNINAKVSIGGQLSFKFTIVPNVPKTIAFDGGLGDGTAFSAINELIVSAIDASSNDITIFLNYLNNSKILLSQQNQPNFFGHYQITGYTQIGLTDFYKLDLEFIGGNGTIGDEQYYDLISFVLTSTSDSLLTQFVVDSYIGTRLKPSNGLGNGFYFERNANESVGYSAVNTNTGNGAVALNGVGIDTNPYIKNISITKFGPNYYVPLLANKGGVIGTEEVFIGSRDGNDVSILTGGDIATLSRKFIVKANGQLQIPTTPATGTTSDKLLVRDVSGNVKQIDYTAGGGGILHGVASGTDTYTATITGPTSYAEGDAYLIRFTNGNTTGATLNINGLGAVPLYRNNDGPILGGDIADGGEMLCIYNTALNEFQVIGVSPNSLLAYITNDDSVTITKGMPVYAFSGTGDRMTVKRAFNISDATSAQTVGLVLSTSIAAGQKGFIIMQGLLDGLSILPTATWADGDPVYLGATAGTITNVKPYAPNHLVYLGVVTTASNGSAGRLYVRVQNGYELDELHNVQAQTPTVNDILYYFGGAPGQWKTASIPTVLGYTPQSVLSGTGIVKSTAGVISYINGSSTQFVKADGSLDSSTYLTSASLTGYVPYTGATADVDLGIRKLASVDIIAFDGTLGANLTTSGDQEGLYSRSSGKELAIYDGNLREYWFAEGVITYNDSTRLTTISSDLIQTSGVNNGIDNYVGLSSAGYEFEFTGISGSGESDFGKAFLQSSPKFGFTSRINVTSNDEFTIISNDANVIRFRAERTSGSNYTECFQNLNSYIISNNDYSKNGFFYINFANRKATLGDVSGDVKNTKIVVDDANENIEFISKFVNITGATTFQWDGDDIARIIDINDGFVTSKLITGYVSGAGTVTASDTILEAIEKLDGNIAAISAGSGITRSIQSIAVNTAAGSTAATDYVYLVSGPTTLTLPTAVGNTNKYEIKRTGVNTVSIATTGGQTIDSSASPITINVQYASISVISDGANWFII
jgi:hypothetical protein